MKVAIFGSSGLLGSAVAGEVSKRGYECLRFSRRGSPTDWQNLHSEALPLENKEKVTRRMLNLWPDSIVNCAAVSSPVAVKADPAGAHITNVEGARNLAEIASHLGARYIHLSTDMVFDGTSYRYRSTDQPNPLNEYGRQKLEAEKLVLSAMEENVVVLRITLLNGNSPEGKRSPHEKILNALATGDPLTLFNDEFRQPCSSQNVASVILELLERSNLNGLFHWAGKEKISRYDLGIRILRRFGFNENAVVKRSLQENPGLSGPRPSHLSFELSPLQGKLKTEPTTIQEQLNELIVPHHLYQWYRENADDPSKYLPRF